MAVDLWQLIERTNIRWTLAIRLIDRDISQVLQDAVLLIGRRRSLQQIWMAVDEAGINALGHKVRLTQQRAQETNVGSNTSDVEFLKGTASTLHGLLEILATAGHLHQQRVEVRRDFRTHGSRTVQADTSATWRTVGGQGAGIWTEAVIRVFGGNAALQRKAIELDVFWRRSKSSKVAPAAICIWDFTISMPVTSSVTVCSTCTRGFISMKTWLPRSSTKNSTVPAPL